MKFLNRQCEILLRDTELLHSVLLAACRDEDKKAYPELELERLWKILLLNQFHDVLPGSSIEDVHREACFYYKEVLKGAAGLMDTAVRRLFGKELNHLLGILSVNIVQGCVTIPSEVFFLGSVIPNSLDELTLSVLVQMHLVHE